LIRLLSRRSSVCCCRQDTTHAYDLNEYDFSAIMFTCVDLILRMVFETFDLSNLSCQFFFNRFLTDVLCHSRRRILMALAFPNFTAGMLLSADFWSMDCFLCHKHSQHSFSTLVFRLSVLTPTFIVRWFMSINFTIVFVATDKTMNSYISSHLLNALIYIFIQAIHTTLTSFMLPSSSTNFIHQHRLFLQSRPAYSRPNQFSITDRINFLSPPSSSPHTITIAPILYLSGYVRLGVRMVWVNLGCCPGMRTGCVRFCDCVCRCVFENSNYTHII
jgi:hypothetical protein